MRILVGQVVGVHGIQGILKVQVALEDVARLTDFEITDEQGNVVPVKSLTVRPHESALVKVKGLHDRTEAEKWVGQTWFVDDRFFQTLPDDEYYSHDLIGLTVYQGDDVIGKIHSVQNYGAGDIIVIEKTDGRQELVAFTQENFPHIDLALRRAEVNMPHIVGDK